MFPLNIERALLSISAGICREISSGVIPSGTLQAQLNVGRCDGFNETFNAFTGLASVSTINIEELPTRAYKTNKYGAGIDGNTATSLCINSLTASKEGLLFFGKCLEILWRLGERAEAQVLMSPVSLLCVTTNS